MHGGGAIGDKSPSTSGMLGSTLPRVIFIFVWLGYIAKYNLTGTAFGRANFFLWDKLNLSQTFTSGVLWGLVAQNLKIAKVHLKNEF